MNIGVISVTNQGDEIAYKLKEALDVDVYSKSQTDNFNFRDACKTLMENYKAVIFITSTGIAVRAIAPYIKSKEIDPAVLVVDSSASYVISLLSGHLGGANSLAVKVSNILEAEPVITTATDILGIDAPDMIAKENDLVIDNLKDAKDISALLVGCGSVVFFDEKGIIETPRGYRKNNKFAKGIVYVTNKINLDKNMSKDIKTLKLVRKNILLGIGCRKDFDSTQMRNTVLEMLEKYNIDKRAVKAIGTVEVKKDEKAIIDLANYLQCEIKIFKTEEIKAIQHKYEGSDFVEKTIGVRSVCQPCVELLGGKNFTEKLKLDGMTLSIGELNI